MKHTILIVDDSDEDVFFTRRAIAKVFPHTEIQVAYDGEAALALLHDVKQLPSLILLDLNLPRLNGFEVLLKIRSDAHFKNLQIVILTNSALRADKKRSLEAGADFFLQKALDMDLFNRDIKVLLERYLS